MAVAMTAGPLDAWAKPQEHKAGKAPLAAGSSGEARAPKLLMSQLQTPAAGARAGKTYVLRAALLNEGTAASGAPVTVQLTRVGRRPRTVGRTVVRARAHSTTRFNVRVRVPRGLRRGSYALTACVPSDGATALTTCVTAPERVKVGGGDALFGAKAAPRVAATLPDLTECSSGARSLSKYGDIVYPEMGNGGYISVHTDIFMQYDAVTNMFLPGNHVDLTQRATQCLTDFSLDFEPKNTSGGSGASQPNMSVDSVLIDGKPVPYEMRQPTYPGNPNGWDDPDPNAHAIGLNNPVSASNPLPPACNPTTTGTTQNGQQCPKTKLVITPLTPIPAGTTFKVTVNYTGKPGTHTDPDGSVEGWFRNNTPAGDGSFVTTEPIGGQAWMPLNNHPRAKPTYDFYDTVNNGRYVAANGELAGITDNGPSPNFPEGSRTFHWHSPAGIANYLVTNSVGAFDYYNWVGANGLVYNQFQASGITAAKKATNKAVMDQQDDLTQFQQRYNGPFPFTTDGVVIGIPSASFEEEMQTMITFNGGSISLGTFGHENMHQWWGDNVAEDSFNLTFFKEGFARFGEYLWTARTAGNAAGPIDSPAWTAAFDKSLNDRFNTNYANASSYWTAAPSKPTAASLFNSNVTYNRPGTAYLALRQVLGQDGMTATMKGIQRDYGGGTITEPQLLAEFQKRLPNASQACADQMAAFFVQWFDTAYPSGSKPEITGPGLNGKGFYFVPGCTSPIVPVSSAALSNGPVNGYYSNPTVTLSVKDELGKGIAETRYRLDDGDEQVYTEPFQVTGDGPHTLTYYSVDADGNTEWAKRLAFDVDGTAPVSSVKVAPTAPGRPVGTTLTLSATDATSGVDSIEYQVDGGRWTPYKGTFDVPPGGTHTIAYRATDLAGNVEAPRSLRINGASCGALMRANPSAGPKACPGLELE